MSGSIYALFSGQPLTIIGSTGPVLAFIKCLYSMSRVFQVPFLPLYAWTGMWTSVLLAGFAAFSLSDGVKYLSRFTDEVFANLISFIFIYEASKNLIGLIKDPLVRVRFILVRQCPKGALRLDYANKTQEPHQRKCTRTWTLTFHYHLFFLAVKRSFSQVPPERALLSVLVAFVTLTVATTLAKLRSGALFTTKVRGHLSDFGPTLGVIAGILVGTFTFNR